MEMSLVLQIGSITQFSANVAKNFTKRLHRLINNMNMALEIVQSESN